MTFTRHQPPYMSDKQINAFVDGVETPHSVTVKKSRILPTLTDKKVALEPGLFVCQIGYEFHFLPRTTIKQKFANKKGIVAPWQVFKVGDKLLVVEPHVSLTIAALAQDATVELKVSDSSDLFKFTGLLGSTPEGAASEMALFINSSPILSHLVSAIADANKVHVFSADGITVHTLTATGGTITTTPTNGKMAVNTPVGEIAAISSETAGEITLADNPSMDFPVGAHIGVPVNDILGYCHFSTDWTNRDSINIAPIAAAHGTYENALPYIDGDIKRRLALRIRKKF